MGFILFAKKTFRPSFSNANRDQENMYFLLYWLNKHVVPNKSKGVKVEWIPLVKALHNFDDVATGPFLLAHLYHLLYEINLGAPFETNLNGPTWMVQLWLQWYFLELRAPNLESPINHSTFACLYFFKVCKTLADLEWGASVLRIYPWFSNQAFQDAFGEDVSAFCKEKFISCIQQRYMAWGARNDRYESGLEIYHPNFCSR